MSILGKRSLLLPAVGVVALVGVFAAGGAVGMTFADSGDDDPPAPAQDTAMNLGQNVAGPAIGNQGVGGGPTFGGQGGDALAQREAQAAGSAAAPMAADEAARSASIYASCSGTIPGGATTGGIDLAALGFDLRPLSGDFVLQSLTVRSEADCDENGLPVNDRLVVDSAWLHAPSGYSIWLTQRQGGEPVANTHFGTMAEFQSGDYAFNVSVGGMMVPFAAATDAGGDTTGTDAGGEVAPVAPDVMPYPGGGYDDEQAKTVLDAAMAQLATDVAAACFWQQADGTWESLAGLGIGDPRGVIPAGFTEQDLNLSMLVPPADDCGNTAAPVNGASFNASFGDGSYGWITISAWQITDPGQQYPGVREASYLSWSNGAFQFDISANNGDGGLGTEVLTAIAQALDPAFANACIISYDEVEDADLAGYGIGVPVAPDGYSVESRSARVPVVSPNCENATYTGDVNASWDLSNSDGSHISANAYISGSASEEPGYPGTIGEGYISWQSANGVYYNVSSWSEAGAGASQDTLIAVAQSMDPGLDVSTLDDGFAGGGVSEKPVPAAR